MLSEAGRAKLSFATKVTHALKNPNRALAALNKDLAEGHLIDFAEVMWPVIEPGRPFVRGWAIEAVCDHLEAVTAGHIHKLLMNVPPGLMKSLSTNVLWPAWEWGPKNRPDLRYVGASYNQDLTIRDNRRCRQLIESPVYQELWGDRFYLVADQNAKVRYDTDKRGFKIATSVGGMGTGERGDRFVADDPHNVKGAESEAKLDEAAQWFTEVVPTRVNDLKLSAFVVIMQRVHERDVSGLALAADLGYTHLELPMEYEPDRKCFTDLGGGKRFEDPRTEEGELLFPERFDRPELDDLKKQLSAWGGEYAVAGQLQQRPAPRGGGMFKVDKEEVKRRMLQVAPAGGHWVRGWDIAGSTTKKSPFTASVKGKMVGDLVYISNVTRERKEIEQAEEHILDTAKIDGISTKQDLPQDPGSAGKSQKRHMAGKLGKLSLDFIITPESGDKETRAIGVASMWNAGNVVLVGSPAEAWVDPFLAELSTFPRGEFKDQVDALSRMYSRLLKDPNAGAPVGGDEIDGSKIDEEEIAESETGDEPLY
jgi:predicted phage terminase large subunit-like protein